MVEGSPEKSKQTPKPEPKKPIFGVLDLSPEKPTGNPPELLRHTETVKRKHEKISVEDYLSGKLRPESSDTPRHDKSQVGSSEGEYTDKLLQKVDTDIQDPPSLLFTGTTGIPLKDIRQYGTDSPERDETYAFTKDELRTPDPETTIWDHAEPGAKDAIVIIYDGDKLLPDPAATPFLYKFAEGVNPRDALVAGYEVQVEPKKRKKKK